MRLLVTGADGYIGSLLTPLLRTRGHEVTALDTGYYERGCLYAPAPDCAHGALRKDLRHVDADDLAGMDGVIHLGELSNDPLGELNPSVTSAINYQGSVRLAQIAKRAGVARFVYASSCSVYGAGRDGWLNEQSPLNPQTTYARCKALVETDVGRMADDEFSPVFLRNATAYGASPRMRFDIVLNNLAGLARTTGRIAMTGDGTPWRPLAHVLDICRAMACAIEAPRAAVHGEVFNVGHDDQNYQIRDIATIVAHAVPGCTTTTGSAAGDRRSYRVSFAKIHEHLPGFACEWDARAGAAQLRDLFEGVGLTQKEFEFPPFTRLQEMKHLLGTGQLDADLFWRRREAATA